VQSSSSRVLAILINDSLDLESEFDTLDNLVSFMTNLKLFADWYQARIIDMVYSAIYSFFIDTKVAISAFFAVSLKRKQTSPWQSFPEFIYCLERGSLSAHWVCQTERLQALCGVGRLFPTKIRAIQLCVDLIRDSASVGDSNLLEISARMLLFSQCPLLRLKASLENYFLYLDKYTSLSCFFGSRKPQW
jgi:hypothetical protein